MSIDIRELAANLRGEIGRFDGEEAVRAPGPGHSPGDRSMWVKVGDHLPDGFLAGSFVDADAADIPGLRDYVRREGKLPPFEPKKSKANGKARAEITDKYPYRNAEGDPVLIVCRTKTKEFLQQRPDGHGGWDWKGIPAEQQVPFHAPELAEAIGLGKTIHIVEGEKDVLSLERHGLVATTNAGGAGKWWPSLTPWFKDAHVIILPDSDAPGRQHALKVRAALVSVAASVRVVRLPGLAEHGDVSDFLAAGGDPAIIERLPDADPAEPPPPRGMTAADLQNAVFPPISFVVERFIAEGLTLLAGRPKLGKSWLVLDVGNAVARGGYTLGNIKCEAGDVLYLALEDNPRRMKARMEKVCPIGRWPDRLTFWYADDLQGDGGSAADRISAWIEASPNPRLVIIDTLKFVRPERMRDEDPYAHDYRSIAPFKRLADVHGLALLVVHHTRKQGADDALEIVSGTNGLTGAADTVLVLDRSSEGCTLYGRGRDIEEVDVAVKFDRQSCRWSVMGDADEVRRSDERSAILAALAEAGEPLSPREIADATGQRYGNVRPLLVKMGRAGEVTKSGRGKYVGATPSNPPQQRQQGNIEDDEP